MKHRVKQFMGRTGILMSPEDMDKESYIKYQLGYVERLLEEVLELKEALEQGDIVNSVKELIDVKYVAAQLDIGAEVAGIDVNLAEELVSNNNDDKYSTNYDFIEAKYIEWGQNDPWFQSKLWIDGNNYEGLTWFCLKDKNGKIRKFVDFESVDLTECIPEELL